MIRSRRFAAAAALAGMVTSAAQAATSPSASPPKRDGMPAGPATHGVVVRPPADVDPGMKVIDPRTPTRARIIRPRTTAPGSRGGGVVVPK